MGNIVVTPLSFGLADDNSDVKIEWKKEGKFGPFTVDNKAKVAFGGISDLEALGAPISTQNEWQKSDIIIVTFEGLCSTNGTSKGAIKFATDTAPSFCSIKINTQTNLKFSFPFFAISTDSTGVLKYFAPIYNPNGDNMFPPSYFYYINLGVTNGYYTIYTGKYILK